MEQSKLIFMRKFIYIFLTIIVSGLSTEKAFSQALRSGEMSGNDFMTASGGRVALTGDVTLTSKIVITKDFILDLNGHVLRAGSGFTDDCLIEIGTNTSSYTITITSEHSGNVSNSIELYTGTSLSGINGAVITAKTTRGIIIKQPTGCTISNCKIMGCYTTGSGGGINVYTNGQLTMNNVEVSYNYANDSGAGIQGRRLNLTNCNISYNMVGMAISRSVDTKSVYGCGGGLYIADATDVTCKLDGCTISHNYAPRYGGGIYSITNTDIKNSNIEYNYAMPITGVSSHDQSWGRGGGFYICRTDEKNASKTFNLTNTTINNNASKYFGGGGQIGLISKDYSTLNIINSHISNNEAILRGAGGLHVTGQATLNLNSGSISNNTARETGGGIHCSRTCVLNLNGGEMRGNTIYGRGGAINLSTGSNLVLNGTNIIENNAITGFDSKYSSVTISHDFVNGICTWTTPTYSNNTPITGYGGGVAVDAGTCTIQNNSIVNSNNASADGGGIALVMIDTSTGAQIPTLTMYNGSISNNQTSGNGGGVYIMRNNSSSLSGNISATIEGGTVSGNKAVKNGGGVYLDTGSQFTMADGVTLSENKAGNGGTGSGGAVYVSQGTATINGGSITSNTASANGGALYVNGNVTVTKITLDQNSATSSGGALYVQTGTVSMNNIVMNNNTATADGGGLYLGNGSLTIGENSNNKISNNQANNGAGVCIANGTLALTRCNITNNKATRYGGGVYVANTSASTINLGGDGVFENNEADAGGGMAIGGAITLNFEGSIQNNTASNGGGIYLFKGSASSGATLNFKDGFIRNNHANGNTGTTGYHETASSIAGFGGGIFLDDGTTFKTTLGTGATFGFYGNKANRGADDIFANGNGTTVNLPDIGGMELADFDVPTPELYWVEDYTTDDTQYSASTKVISTAGYKAERYQDALEAGSPNIGKLEAVNYSTYKNKYMCLSLGYQLYYVTLQKKGLEAGDIAIFDISYKKNGTPVSYRKVKFIGKGTDTPVNMIIALPPNTWTFTEDAKWSWKYNIPEPLVKEIATQSDITDPIVFTNTLKSNTGGVNTKIHYETHKENRMKL